MKSVEKRSYTEVLVSASFLFWSLKKKSNNCGKMFANQEMGRFIERSMGKVRKEERMESARWRF